MCYERKRKAGNVPGLVDATPALDKIKDLTGAGWRVAEIARAAHIDRSVVVFIVKGRQRINADTCFAIAGIAACRRAEFVAHIDPKVAKARGRKAAASLTVEVKVERSRKIWVTRHANQRVAQQIADRQRILLSPAEQRARQEVIMAERRRMAQHNYRIAHPPTATLIGMPTGSWVDEAVCAQTDPDTFFPEKGGSTRQAKAICLGCPVRQRCLDWALQHEERFGIWGGKSERERRRMARNIA
jgi:WhiB family redox-sensing transcriptional regulator